MKLKTLLVFSLLFGGVDFLIYFYVFDYSLSRTLFHTIYMTGAMVLAIYYVGPAVLGRVGKALEKTLPNLTLLPGERILHQGLANHFKGVEGVGGRLTLTDKRLVFMSHKLNIQNHEEHLDLGTIVSIEPHSRFAKGIILTTNTSVNHTFIVNSREQWIALLHTASKL